MSSQTRMSPKVFIMNQGEYFILYFLLERLVAAWWLQNQTKSQTKPQDSLGRSMEALIVILLTTEETETLSINPRSLSQSLVRCLIFPSRWANEVLRSPKEVSVFLHTCRGGISLCFICLCCEYSKSLSCQHVSQIKWTREWKLNQVWKVIWGR